MFSSQTSSMFSISLVTVDSYQSVPVPELDVVFSDFRGTDIRQVPVIRIFGSTPSGIKTCLHVHGVFPYMYVPCTIEGNVDSFIYRLAAALDSAINVSLGSTMSNTQHVYKIQRVSGIPFYGYHEKEHSFLKIYFYNPAMIKRAADLLQNGAVLNQSLQPHEAHIPFILQFMIDYNLYGMSLINLKDVKHRQRVCGGSKENSQNESTSLSDSQIYLPANIVRQSTCKLEVDAQASKILNREEILKGLDLNPGIAAIWNDEKHRREAKDLEQAESQLLFTNNNDRVCSPTNNDIYQEKRFAQRIQSISQVSDSVSSNPLSYPLEIENKDNSLNASHVLNHFKPLVVNKEKKKKILLNNGALELEKSDLIQQIISQDESVEASMLDTEDMQLVDMLANLAEANDDDKFVDNDSMLGSQYSTLSSQIKEDNEEDEVEDLNITSLDLDSLSSWNSVPKTLTQSSLPEVENNEETKNHKEIIAIDENNFEDISSMNFPQYDGPNDLLLNNTCQLSSKSITTKVKKRMNTYKKLEMKSIMHLFYNVNAMLNRLNRSDVRSYVNVLQNTLIKLQISFNATLDIKQELCKILYECYLPKCIEFSTELFCSNMNNYTMQFDVQKKQTREFKSRRRKRIQIVKQELYTFPKNMLYLHKLDHQGLDVYDVDQLINHTSTTQKIYLNETCSNQIDHDKSHFMKLEIPALDGNVDESSSDSEMDQDFTIQRQEKRICVYKSATKSRNEENVVSMSQRKRRHNFENSGMESPNKRRNTNSSYIQSDSHTPTKTRKLESPRSSGKYFPLNVTIISPKASRNVETNEPSCSRPRSPYGTPKRNSHHLRMNLLRDRICALSSEKKQVHSPHKDNEENEILYDTFNEKLFGTSMNKESNDLEKEDRDIINTKQNFTPKSSKEVRKRLNFLNINEKEIDSLKDKNDECDPENLSLTEKIIDVSHENSDSVNLPIMNFSHHENNIQPYIEEDEEENHEQCNSSVKTSQVTEEENFEMLDEDEKDICNMTYTQYLNKKLESELDNPSFPSSQNASTISRNKLITITTKFNPPSRERIINSMKIYNISECKSTGPFFSNKVDLIKQKENSNKNNNIDDLAPFKPSLDRVTSIKLWRRVKINEFYPSGSNIKSCDIKRVLAGYSSLIIQPLIQPPAPKNVKTWLQAKKYLLKRSDKQKEIKQNVDIATDVEEKKNDVLGSNSDKPIADADNEFMKKLSQSTNTSQYSNGSNDSLNSSVRKMLENPLLHLNNDTQQQLGISYGQIEYSMKGHSGDVADENLQNARGLTMHQYLTLLSVEVHVVTRGDLLPDPERDSIEAIFYAIYNDVPQSSHVQQMDHGAIVVNSSLSNTKLKNIYSTSTSCATSYVSNEEQLLNSLIILIRHYDPDILLGWEIETLSWGYILQRASRICFNNFTWQISRVSNVTPNSKAQTLDKDNFTDSKIPGRIILDVWRIMRHETALLNYSFESVMYNVMRERISCPTFKTLSEWWKHRNVTIQWRVTTHYVVRVLGTLKILIHLDVIGRTCEHARLFGIQFYEVFSRGSQFRVESMMLRLAKPLNYIPISPNIQQRAKMRAPQALPLIMEPQSIFYSDPLIVLDFQSLYPSIIIAYNYCFSTCLGRVEHIGQYEPFEFGAATLRVKRSTAIKLQDNINFSPCGVAFVKPEVRLGILPRMLSEILNTRLMVKQSMKTHGNENRVLQRILHSQQLGLKLIANVTYGYTSANFSGRMPCIEIGDSVVSKGRETLERAIKLVESTPKWGAQVVYGDTDSLFILLPGKSRQDAFTIGAEIADAVTAANPVPVKLKFEKVLQPSILQTKKRYCGYMYESPNQTEPEYLAKGIETVRRDGCPAVAKILEKSLKILFDTKDLSLVKQYVSRQFDKILRRRISIQDLTFAKEFRGLHGYKASACVPALELTRRLTRKDPRAVPRTSERVRYVIVAGAPNQPLIHCIRTPMEVMTDESLNPNSVYYITKVIIPPLNRCLNLIGIDVNTWYREMCHRQTPDKAVSLFTENQKSTIRQFFSTVVCATCGDQTQKDICPNCLAKPSQTVTILHEKLRWLERTHHELTMICQSCTGYLDEPKCESLECPVLYRLVQAKRDLIQIPYLNNIICNGNSFSNDEGSTRQ